MPKIVQRQSYNGAEERLKRLGLMRLWNEFEDILTGFDLRVKEERDANGGAAVREILDSRFEKTKGWTKTQVGDVDWMKCLTVNGTRVCLGVELQISGRSDLTIVDVVHLRDQLIQGSIDVAVIVAPSDHLGIFLTDRGPQYKDAVKAVDRARAQDLPFIVLGIEHDGPGPALAKKKTRQGRGTS